MSDRNLASADAFSSLKKLRKLQTCDVFVIPNRFSNGITGLQPLARHSAELPEPPAVLPEG